MRNGARPTNRILKLAREKGVLRVRDLMEHSIHPEYLRRLAKQGLITKTGHGRYILAKARITENHSLAEVSRWVPHGVICLLTALRFHEIGTQAPFEVWLALDRRAAKPGIETPKIRVVRFSGDSLTEGIEDHKIEGVPVKVYCAAKTVADCFKYRNKVGLDVALEALREGRRDKRFTNDELWRFAKICRVANVMRPYMEAME